MKEIANILNKHLGAVHNSSPLSIVQRKAVNIMLKHAEKEMHLDKEHKISVRNIMNGIGWKSVSKTPDNLKECLNELVSIKIQWNVFEVDRQSKWVTSTLLASAAIKGGDVYYSYSKPLRGLLSGPNIYAKLDLGIQKLFKTKYSMLIWEYIVGELSSKKTNSLVTSWLSYGQMLKLTYLEHSMYTKRYSLFLERVVAKAINEINLKSDLLVEYKTLSDKGKVTHIRFCASKKNMPCAASLLDADSSSDVSKLREINLSTRQIDLIQKKYSEEEINKAYKFLVAELKSSGSQVKNPVAFFKKALEEGWVLPEVVQKNLESSATTEDSNMQSQIRSLEESERCQQVRLKLLEQIGNAPYTSWIHPCEFTITDSELSIYTSSSFSKDWIESKLHSDIQSALRELDSKKITRIAYKLQEELEGA